MDSILGGRDIWYCIFCCLDDRDIRTLARTCKLVYQISKEPLIWELRLGLYYPRRSQLLTSPHGIKSDNSIGLKADFCEILKKVETSEGSPMRRYQMEKFAHRWKRYYQTQPHIKIEEFIMDPCTGRGWEYASTEKPLSMIVANGKVKSYFAEFYVIDNEMRGAGYVIFGACEYGTINGDFLTSSKTEPPSYGYASNGHYTSFYRSSDWLNGNNFFWGMGDYIGVYLDFVGRKIKFYKNGEFIVKLPIREETIKSDKKWCFFAGSANAKIEIKKLPKYTIVMGGLPDSVMV